VGNQDNQALLINQMAEIQVSRGDEVDNRRNKAANRIVDKCKIVI
jgi:hypothetical protein